MPVAHRSLHHRSNRQTDIMFTFTEWSEDQHQFSMAHLPVAEPLFICSWSRDDVGQGHASGAFMCGSYELERFLMATDAPKLVALQVLVPTGTRSWTLRTTQTVANWMTGDHEHGKLVFGDDVELFDSWSKRLPITGSLIPLWSAPHGEA